MDPLKNLKHSLCASTLQWEPPSTCKFFAMLAGGGSSETAYQIERSLRFNDDDSAYLSFTPGSSTNRRTLVRGGWLKLGNIGSGRVLMAAVSNASNYTSVTFGSGNTLQIVQLDAAAVTLEKVTTQVFRDPTAWIHWWVIFDTTNATAEDRVQLWINGVRVTSWATNTIFAQNTDTFFNHTVTHYIGRDSSGTYFDGYMAELIGTDGTIPAATTVAETSTTTDAWNPKSPSVTYGTNGFKLNFSDNSNTTAATLGKDSSTNTNNWTPNNFSVTAGAGNDSLTDTPTNYGSGTSGGDVRGNFSTLNSIRRSNSGTPTYSNGNLGVVCGGTAFGEALSTMRLSLSGKWYAEVTPTAGSDWAIGAQECKSTSTSAMGVSSDTYAYLSSTGNTRNSNISIAYGDTYTTNDVIGVAFDGPAGKMWFSKNGTWQNSGDPAAGTNQAFQLMTASDICIAVANGTSGSTTTYVVNFGQRDFAYDPPSGFKPLCTQHLANSTVQKPSTGFKATLYAGTGATLSVSGLSFGPDLVWLKSRSAATDHSLYDVARGATNRLESNNTDAEVTGDTGVTAFNSDGFTLGTLAQVNTNAATYVAWCWEEGATYGFDIVLYTGTGAAHAENHGLGAVPSMMMVKCLSAANNWAVYHSANTTAPETDYLLLNSTAATADDATYWNDVAPTSTQFTVGTNADVNTNTATYVAYLWAPIVGFSFFGSYTGNGNADGPVAPTGFRPAFNMVKRTDSTSDWRMYDNARSTHNPTSAEILANTAAAETASGNNFDLLAVGFKVRDNSSNVNASGGTYVFAAFAQDNFKNARAA
jgi:hypothetical protein